MKKKFLTFLQTTKHLIYSLSIHLLIILLLSFNINLNKADEIITEKNKNTDIEIIEINEGNDINKKQIVSDKFYWGIGIISSANFENRSPYGLILIITVTEIKKGYSAYDSDLKIGDRIYLVNNDILSNQNDIKGDEPKHLILTILRNNNMLNINIKRVKVYY